MLGLKGKSARPTLLGHIDIEAGFLWVSHNLGLGGTGKDIYTRHILDQNCSLAQHHPEK